MKMLSSNAVMWKLDEVEEQPRVTIFACYLKPSFGLVPEYEEGFDSLELVLRLL